MGMIAVCCDIACQATISVTKARLLTDLYCRCTIAIVARGAKLDSVQQRRRNILCVGKAILFIVYVRTSAEPFVLQITFLVGV